MLGFYMILTNCEDCNASKISKVKRKSRKYRWMFEVNSREKLRQVWEKDWSQQVEHMQVPNGTGPGARKSKRPLSVCYTRRKYSMKTSHKSVNGRVR